MRSHQNRWARISGRARDGFSSRYSLRLWAHISAAGFALACAPGLGASDEFRDELWSLPNWAVERVLEATKARGMELAFWVNPYYIQPDLDGDGNADLVFLVKDKTSGKRGIAILLYEESDLVVLGAGASWEAAGDDWYWLDYWSVYPKGQVGRGVEEGEPPVLTGDAILVGKAEAASGLIYRSDGRLRWYQQGD